MSTSRTINTGGGGSSTVRTMKPSSTTRSATSTLADDPHLVVALEASSTYLIEFTVYYIIANATMDWKYGLAYSGTMANFYRYSETFPAGSGAGADMMSQSQADGLVATSSFLSSAATGFGMLKYRVIANTTTAGNFAIQWAQNTSDAGNATVLAGSYIEITKA